MIMIRLIKQRLIIPKGDTGSFSIPALENVPKENTIAIFSIFNNDEVIYSQTQIVDQDTVTFTLEHEDTVGLKLGVYSWDIKVYVNPRYNENNLLIDGDQVHSYYTGFKTPECEIVLAPKEGG